MNESYLLPANAEEPFFTIRGRDPAAVVTIHVWIEKRRSLIQEGILPNTKEEYDQIESALLKLDAIKNYQPKSFGNTILSDGKELYSFTIPGSMYNSMLGEDKTYKDFIHKKIHFHNFRTIFVIRIRKLPNGDAIFEGTASEGNDSDWTVCLPEKE